MLDFANISREHLAIGGEMRMVFRVKDVDPLRGYTRYFWKATPQAALEET